MSIKALFSYPERYIESGMADLKKYLEDDETLEAAWASLIYATGFSQSVYTATYSFTSPLVAAVLKRKLLRDNENNNTKLIYDGSAQMSRAPEMAINELLKATRKNSIITGRTPYDNGIMHNKFVVAGSTVMIGSPNFGLNAAFVQDNNILIVNSYQLAQELRRYWTRMSEGKTGKMGTGNIKTIRHIKLSNGVIISPLYAPKDDICGKIIGIIEKLDDDIQEIRMAMFTLTRDDICKALCDAANKGASVKVLLDNGQTSGLTSQSRIASTLDKKGVDVQKMDRGTAGKISILLPPSIDTYAETTMEERYIMHHKFYTIKTKTGKNIIITGSQNATYSGNLTNDEFMLVVEEDTNGNIYNSYSQRFEEMWKANREE